MNERKAYAFEMFPYGDYKKNDLLLGTSANLEQLCNSRLYSGNMFIMHRDQFKQYIKLITPIYNILFNMIYPFPNVANRAASFILERVTSFIIIYMINTNKNLELKQGNYIKLGDIVT